MKASIYQQYGPPQVAQIKEVPTPTPQSNELLVKVYASTVNRTDAGFRSAEYFISRFWSGLFKPKCQILGCEFAGVVQAVGVDVDRFKVGDCVFGFNDTSFGGHAQYLCISQTDAVATIPANLDFNRAAALTEGAHYALVDIRAAKVQSGHQVLVYGATGAIGSAAVQILKYVGAKVTAVCSTQHVALIQSLGADRVIDYQTQDFTQTETRFDFIFDAVGKSSYKQCKPLLTQQGVYISTELGKYGVNVLLALVTPLFGTKKLLFPLPTISQADLIFIKDLVQQNAFMPVIDRKYTLDQIVEAYTYVESGQKVGNVILQLIDAENILNSTKLLAPLGQVEEK